MSQSEMKPIVDPDNYRRMSEAFASPAEADAALEAFSEDVRAARQKHRIADVLVAVCVNIKYEDGHEGQAFSMSQHGSVLVAEPLAAYAYGRAVEQRRESIGKLLKGKQ